jgi:divalent metal cation (Fe/Co/Zn/Cd) transporter
VRSIRLRWIGHHLHAEADLAIHPATTVEAVHALAHAAEHRLTQAVPNLTTAAIHAYPPSHQPP